MSSEPPQGGGPPGGPGGTSDPHDRDEPGQSDQGRYGPEQGRYGAQPYGGYPPPGTYPSYSQYPQYPSYPDGGGAPAGTSPDPLVPFSFGDWFAKVIGVVQRSGKPLLVIQAAVYVPLAILQAVLQLLGVQNPEGRIGVDPTEGFVGAGTSATILLVGFLVLVVSVVLGALAQAASVFVIVRDAARRPYAPQHVFEFAKSRALPVIGWGLLAGLLVMIGFVALVLPGIYLAVIFGGALTGVVVIERAGIGRTFALVNPRFFPVLGRFVVFFLLAVVFSIVASLISAAVAFGSPVVATFLSSVLTLPITLAGAAAAVVVYAENRFHEQSRVHTPVLADEIDRP